MSTPVIGFAGMTHLGFVSAVAAAERGAEVVCYDPDASLIEDLGKGHIPVVEPDLRECLARNEPKITFTSSAMDLNDCHVVYVAPDVMTDDRGKSDLTVLNDLFSLVDAKLPNDSVMVILSQVPPGFTRLRNSGSRPLYYQVETLIFGAALDRALNPERIIVGCNNADGPLSGKYAAFLRLFDCPILPMRYESAELAKISINCCLAAQISVANTLAEICENIGADWSEIVPALRLDARIGEKAYLTPGLGISGGNLERDLATVIAIGEEQQTHVDVIQAAVSNSLYRKDWAGRTLQAEVLDKLPEPVIAIWGLTYKENTHSTKNAPSLRVIDRFNNCSFQVHDPVVDGNALGRRNVCGFEDPLQAVAGADCLMILSPWQDYQSIPFDRAAAAMGQRLLIDPYGIVDAGQARNLGFQHHTLGKPSLISNT